MALTLLHPTTANTTPPLAVFSDEWHRQEEVEERAWLDSYISDPLSVTID